MNKGGFGRTRPSEFPQYPTHQRYLRVVVLGVLGCTVLTVVFGLSSHATQMGGFLSQAQKNFSGNSGQLPIQRGLVAHLRAQRVQHKAAPIRCILNPMAEHRCTTQNPCVVHR